MEEAEEYNKIHLRLKLVAQILFHLFRQQHCKREISIRNATVNVCLKYQCIHMLICIFFQVRMLVFKNILKGMFCAFQIL